MGRKAGVAAVLLLLALSAAARARNLASPLVEEHAFRQTQTAITVWTFVREGIAPLRYQTPVFGPPWRLPFELPLFQMAAAALVAAGVPSIDVACRLANLLFFYLSALLLYGLCRMHLRPRAASACILMAYVWLPYTILWSRTSMIDYCSVSLALGHALFLLRWLAGTGRRHALALAVGLGCLAMLVKATTVLTVAVLVGAAALRAVRADLGAAGGGRARAAGPPGGKALWVGLLLACLLPLAVGWGWETYAQRVRLASPTTRWFGPQNLLPWFFGTWEQRADPRAWSLLAARLGALAPGACVPLACLGAWCALRRRREGLPFLLAMVSGAVLAVATFFNLYLDHSYYWMAVSPAAAIAVGLGFHFLCFETLSAPAGRAALAGLALAYLHWTAQPALARSFAVAYATEPVCALGERIRAVTPADEHVVVRDHPHGWSPEILYYARRKGLMLWGSVLEMDRAALNRTLAEHRFTTLVTRSPRGDLPLVGEVGGWRIYKLRAAGARERRLRSPDEEAAQPGESPGVDRQRGEDQEAGTPAKAA
jgi:hypothetical protein